MTAAARTLPLDRSPVVGSWRLPILLLAGLGAIVVARSVAVRAGLDPLAVGAGFGVALAAFAALAARWRSDALLSAVTEQAIGLSVGVLFGLVLVGIAVVGPVLADRTTVTGLGRPAAPFIPWATITIVVAVAEEALLRGVLLDRLRRAGGPVLALLVTGVAFALMHVPLYGWQVVPLDLAVGLALGGLRLATRTVAAPAAAHAVADLATWWL
jgi:membrane protease YdiL (CAAX protease family)